MRPRIIVSIFSSRSLMRSQTIGKWSASLPQNFVTLQCTDTVRCTSPRARLYCRPLFISTQDPCTKNPLSHRNINRIPPAKVEEIKCEIRDSLSDRSVGLLGIEELTQLEQQLRSESSPSPEIDHDAQAPEKSVINSIASTDAEVHSFVRRWRSLFLSVLRPRHLSVHWSIEHVDEQ